MAAILSEPRSEALSTQTNGTIFWNSPTATLYEQAIKRGEAIIAEEGPIVARTTPHTGRSPNDKFIVREPSSENQIWWGKVNQPISVEHFERLRARLWEYMGTRDLFVQDVLAGADPRYRLPVRVVSEYAWHSLFVRNMFLAVGASLGVDFRSRFTLVDMPGFQARPEEDGTHSETCILINLRERLILIGGTRYAGEIKKSIFAILNYLLPQQGVFPMHCSANVGKLGDVAIFFGLSGTGKTTLSADPERTLIGDDEHGWSDHGVFNFEGGCYAKVIRLSPEASSSIQRPAR
jgi:phosphoenolpyruvate carboxykinase (ATP)